MQSPGSATTYRAARVSIDLPAAGTGRPAAGPIVVHSVFRAAINLIGPDGLLTIARADVGGLSGGVLIDDVTDLRDLGPRPAMVVRLDRDAIRIPAAGVAVDLRAAARWDPGLRPRPSASAGRRWSARSPMVAQIVARLPTTPGLARVAAADPYLANLAASIRHGDRPAAAGAARGLVGLGPGLTPSGDDILAGAAAALRGLDHPLDGFLEAVLIDIDRRTTAVSAALLRHAARGAFAERIHDLFDALLGEDAAAIEPAVARAAAWGATSGVDLLTGVVLALDAATGVDGRSEADRRWAA